MEDDLKQAMDFWLKYADFVERLREKGYIRSYRDPKADFAEWIVATCLNGELAEKKTNKGYDLIVAGKRIQVKAIAKLPPNPNGYIIQEKKDRENNPKTGATHYAFVWFENLIPEVIFLCSEEFVRNFNKSQIRRGDLEIEDPRIQIIKLIKG